MKTLLATGAVLLALLAYNPTSANAQTALSPSAQASANTLDEFSSARKHRRHVRVYRYYDRYYDPLEYNRSFGFAGQYPGEYAWRRSIGQTVCDLGYGRWDTCQAR
jgi:hypothetical protein